MARLLAPNEREATDKGVATMALLLGTIMLARLAKSRKLSETILDAGKRATALLEQRG